MINFQQFEKIPGWAPIELMQYLNMAVSEMPKDQYYLEIGSFCGRSLVAALHENIAKAIVIDPQNLNVGSSTSEILWNKTIEDFGLQDRAILYQCIAENFTGNIPTIGVFFYDGNHDSGHTYEALNKFSKFLANEALIIVDDYLIYGGDQQTPYPGHEVDIKNPVKTDVDRWILENKSSIVDIKHTPWLNGQAIIKWKK